jgi:predicted porin
LAALAATGAFAQSSVTIKGTFDPSIAYSTTTYGDKAQVSNTFVRNNSQGTSQITFIGTEDLGGGLKASFLYEGDFTTATGASATNGIGNGGGELFAALEGGFGSLKIGAANTPSLSTQAGRQPFGTKIGGGFSGVLGTGHVRENNSVVYASPVMSGFSASLGMSFATSAVLAANTSSTAPAAVAATNAKTDLGLFYAAGPVAAGVSYYKQADVNNQTNLFASYTLGAAKVIVGYHTEDAIAGTVTTTSKGSNIAGTYSLTPAATLLGNYAKRTVDNSTLDKSIVAIGGKYELSKRTSVYARYVSETNDNLTAASAVSEVKTTLVGIQHNF